MRTESEISTIATAIETGFGPARYSVGPAAEARLLLPLGPREVLLAMETMALTVKDVTLRVNKKLQRFVDVKCCERRLEYLFAEVASEVLLRIQGGQSSSSACSSTIHDYQALLTANRISAAPIPSVIGLLGELTFLDRLLDFSPDAWKCWRGPLGDRHDFRSGRDAVEIKTSQRKAATIVQITSLEQLESPSEGNLHLVHLHLDPSVGSEVSIAKLYARCISKVSSQIALSELVAAYGCPDPYQPEWNDLQFNLERFSIYNVRGRFPRVTTRSFVEESLPQGVVALQYSIDLAQAAEFLLAEDDAIAVFEGMAKCLQIS
jgi:hypothetical protein